MSFKIDNIEINGKVILAPMAGITSFSYRLFSKPFGCALVYSEMVSDCGLIYDNTRTKTLLLTNEVERPLAIQLFGGSKETLLKGIELLEKSGTKYDILDLNLACPVPKVTKGNGGSSWLKDLDAMEEMLKAVVRASSKPVSVKVRLGFNENQIEEICKRVQKAGVKFIAIHARTKKELYGGEPHFDLLKNIRDILTIPFAVSGNIFSLEEAQKALEMTRADAVMLARGAIGDPLLIKEINENIIIKRDYQTQSKYLLEFAKLLIEEKGEERAIGILKGIAPKFFKMFGDAKTLRQTLTTKMKSFNDLEEIINKELLLK